MRFQIPNFQYRKENISRIKRQSIEREKTCEIQKQRIQTACSESRPMSDLKMDEMVKQTFSRADMSMEADR